MTALGNKKQKSRSVSPEFAIRAALSDTFVPLSTEVEKISPELAHSKEVGLRGFEYELSQNISRSMDEVAPFLQDFEALKKSNIRDWKLLDRALKDGDAVARTKLLAAHGMEASYRQAAQELDRLADEATNAGYKFKRLKNYWPRRVNNREAMLAEVWSRDADGRFSEALKQAARKKNRILTAEEKAKVVDSLLQNARNASSALGSVKDRTVARVDAKLDPYYANSADALLRHIDTVHNAIETRKLFEKLGPFIVDQIETGRIRPEDESKLAQLIQARFGYRPLEGFLANLRDASYIATMGNSISAITQLGDAVGAIYFGGIREGAKAYGRAIKGRSRVTTKQLGIDNLGEEFRTPHGFGKWLDRTFKWVGINKIDQWGKEAASSAYLGGLMRRARKNKLTERDTRRIKLALGNRSNQAIQDLKDGTYSPDVLFLAYDRISDLQPVSRLEVPKAYLENPRLRLAYQLKTFFLRRFDFLRREAINDIRRGRSRKDHLRGARNLVWLSTLIVLAEGSADLVKDFILGREIDLEDYVWNNLLKLVGISKFHTYVFRREGPGATAVQLALPVQFGLIKDTYRDVLSTTKDDFNPRDFRTWGRIPIGGKFYHWWLGQGLTSNLRSRRRNITQDLEAYYQESPDKRNRDELAALRARISTFNKTARQHSDRVGLITATNIRALAQRAAKD